jgi:hypothetical protein
MQLKKMQQQLSAAAQGKLIAQRQAQKNTTRLSKVAEN